MQKFTSFEDLQQHYAKSGMSGTLALKAARSSRPDLFAKLQQAPHTTTDEEQILKTVLDGRARQNQLQAAIDEVAQSRGIRKSEAARQLRRQRPALFD
ncbi:MAG: hypothetical protein EOS25_13915 [Mesorhizobium sp.]|uniref:hypothetical protein n=1 Tax=Mesorhizobium sp. TaxID=1871066 RepID=UPI000FE5044D|nr:hypothetical protein [Mesorhizobium sp.]RWD51235.1 MAG: hypothetical protein EOS59_06510 [Mesorhizobium sp.]RWE60073.1 MAG: hypothetical protein EOS24_13275 [Mesorhizobium sp.]RWF11528.1 MAG: hypothetical protein EOS69_08795 [Mesorhizobium sp.]RWF18426.1 MAG: hypothetical protein EOS25_13915 [Mesorhizobium sp.]TIY05656.1 MAG: hypothetical protein E5V22_06540 [Mesorhizobium sp.]